MDVIGRVVVGVGVIIVDVVVVGAVEINVDEVVGVRSFKYDKIVISNLIKSEAL